MRLFGLTVTREKALSPVAENRGGWFAIIRESFAGAWQKNIEVDNNLVLSYPAVYACLTLIASDIAKMRVKLVQRDGEIWAEVQNPAYSPVLRKPNGFQNRIQFWESWIISKLTRGNTYVLKARDGRGVVSALYVLDPNRVQPLVADDGTVFYALQSDNVSGLKGDITVPAREIIHDRMNCLFHPLVGTSPILASGLAATQGREIQNSSTRFFRNRAMPSGILTGPGRIAKEDVDRLKAQWEQNYGGDNTGKIAVLGGGLKFESMTMTATDAQLIEQLRWTAEVICSTFHVPPYKIGIGQMPTYNNIQALNVEYYSQCLQVLIEAAELCLDEGLEMGADIGTEFDLDGLLRMDTVTQVTAEKEAVGAGIKAPNEARKRFDLKPVEGGETPYLQQQNYSLGALAKRDAKADPFAKGGKQTPASAQTQQDPPANDNAEAQARTALYTIMKGLS